MTPPRRLVPGRVARRLALALVVAGIVHLGTVLLLAGKPDADVYQRVKGLGSHALLQTFAAPSDADGRIPYRDPAMAEAFCLFDLSASAVAVSLPVEPLDFAVVSVHGDDGTVVYALTNGAAVGGAITLSLSLQTANAGAEDVRTGTLRVPLARPRGFVDVQALAAMPSQRPAAEDLARQLSCRPAKAS